MPDVTGKRLDVAKSDVKRAGFQDDVEVLGGGVFGVVNESSWEVCEQTPAPGEPLTAAPRLTVGRECKKDGAKQTKTPSASPSDKPSSQPEAGDSATAKAVPTLTVKNNPELAKLLRSPQDDELATAFAAKYADRTIEFDGNLGAMQHHGNQKTRYDMLILAGDFSEDSAIGPNFRFVDISPVLDLHPTAKNVPDSISVGDNLHVVARVGEFNEQAGTWELEPIHVDSR
ncbi:DUF4839 domain-containing protein [Pedococcus sp. 2YAF34]|uniref:DUF4839 domain-containing protein n=1 Tax=Pedococcus sp. 2YAF34 TaxID=3233032 RepID=UPI003F9AC016